MPNIKINPQRTLLGLGPKELSKYVAVPVPFGVAGVTVNFDFVQEAENEQLSTVQAVWIDNLDNAGKFTLEPEGTTQRIRVGGGGVGMFPIVAVTKLAFIATHETANATVRLIFLNVPQPYFTYTPF